MKVFVNNINIKKLFKVTAAFCIIFLIAGSVLLYGQEAFAASNKPDLSVSKYLKYPSFLTKNPFETFLYKQKTEVSFKVGELPLMQYNLASLRITGIMSRRGHYYAMIQTPSGRSYIVTAGSIMGISRARVISIGESSILLSEKTFNALGEIRTIRVVMKMK